MTTKFSLGATVVVATALLGVAFNAAAEQPLTIFSRAIGEGQAAGEVTGSMATRMREMTKSEAPVKISAKVLKRFAQQGCARLEIETSQEKVPLKDGGFAPFSARWALNLCVDGSPPNDLTEAAPGPAPRLTGERQ